MNGKSVVVALGANFMMWGVFHYSSEYAWIVAGFGLGLLLNVLSRP